MKKIFKAIIYLSLVILVLGGSTSQIFARDTGSTPQFFAKGNGGLTGGVGGITP